MDVVNGKIVQARTERSRSDIWSALKPSGVKHGSGLVSPPGYSRNGAGPAATMTMEHGSARWHRWPHDTGGTNNILGQPHKEIMAAAPDYLAAQEPFRAGWKWSLTEPNPHNDGSPVNDREYSLSSCDKLEGLEMRLVTVSAPKKQRMETPGVGVAALERRGVMELSSVDQDGVTWIAPLRSLLRKELTVSDVGELGRIVLPKKDAEVQLPLVEAKGKQLEMEEYSFSKRWLFQYKCWINNKSRMYVLENTREFIKHHGLQAHDRIIVYKDSCGNLVVRGQKKLDCIDDHWDAKLLGSSSGMEVKKE